MSTPTETKRQKFVRLAENRTNKILDMIQLLGNLSSLGTYEYTQQDVDKIAVHVVVVDFALVAGDVPLVGGHEFIGKALAVKGYAVIDLAAQQSADLGLVAALGMAGDGYRIVLFQFQA